MFKEYFQNSNTNTSYNTSSIYNTTSDEVQYEQVPQIYKPFKNLDVFSTRSFPFVSQIKHLARLGN